MITLSPQDVQSVIECWSALFEHPAIQQMGCEVELLMAGVVGSGRLPGGRRRKSNKAAESCVHWLIEKQVRRSPLATAVCMGEERLTYGELNRRANQLACELRERGVGPGVLVGVFCERSLDLAVGILGILKSGGAYLPIDIRCPGERLRMMLEDAQVPILLTHHSLRDRLPESAARVICLDEDRELIERHSGENPARLGGPDCLAYVIYTSGTTGVPKGVAITHRSLVNHNLAAIELYGLGPRDRVLQFSAIDFDIAVEEIFPTWVCGACLVMRPDEFWLTGAEFANWCRARGVTVLDLPTAFWHAWTHELALRGMRLPQSLRTVIVGGEAASAQAYRVWLSIGGGRIRWFNTYGPTETTIIATAFGPLANLEPDAVPDPIPIGRPIAHVRVYILDEQLQPVPAGVPGELYIAGAGVARGYLNRPQLNTNRFVPDPFQPGSRMYKTGDRCRQREDGNIEFLGRLDRQVKIRGYRVDPTEVENALQRHPSVRECVVSACGEAGGLRLIAHMTLANGAVPAKLELRRFLAERIPSFMVPADFVVLDTMPLTANGKIDHKALPPANGESDGERGCHDPPRTDSERQLVEIWQELLGASPIGVRDDFFALGGHSLVAARIVTRIEQSMGVQLPVAALLSSPSIAELASRIDTQRFREKAGVLVPLRPRGSRPPVFLVAGAGGHVFVFRELAELLGEHQPVYGLQGIGLDGTEEPLCCMEDIAARYISEITAIQPEGPYFVGGWSMGGLMAYEIAVQLQAQGRLVGAVFVIDMPAPWEGCWARRMSEHLQGFRRRSLRGKIQYLGRRVSRRIAVVKLRFGIYPPVVGFDGPTADLIRQCGLAQCQAERRYHPRPYDGDLVLLKAEQNAEASDPRVESPFMGWDLLVRGRIQVCPVPGNHIGIFTGENVRHLAAAIRGFLER